MIFVVFLLLGILISFKFNPPKKLQEFSSKVQGYLVLILMLLLGISIGLNKNILSNLKSIGSISFTYAVLTSFFSFLAVLIFTKLVDRRRKKK